MVTVPRKVDEDDSSTVTTRSISERTVVAALWLIAARLGTRAIDFISLLVLARVLTPEDFGLVAIALTLVQIAEAVFELPVSQILVRSETITKPMLDTAFTLGAIRGLLLTGLIASLAWPFAAIYNDPRLIALICFLSLAPCSRGLISPAMALYAQAIDFRRDLAIDLISKVCGYAFAGVLAFTTRSYWAIAVGTVITPILMVFISYALAPMRPRWSLAAWPIFAAFLGWTTAAQAISAINWQIDWLILGALVSSTQLGTFSLASSLAGLPEQAIVRPIIRPLLSAFSLIRNDMERLRANYLRTSASIVMLGLPVMLTLSLLAEHIVLSLLGHKWKESWPYLQWMALTLIPPLFTAPLLPLAIALGRSNIFLRQNLSELLVKLPTTIIAGWFYGVYGVIVARGIISIVIFGTSSFFVRQLIDISITRQVFTQWRSILAGTVLVLWYFVTRTMLNSDTILFTILKIAVVGAGGIMIYAISLIILWLLAGRPPGLEAIIINQMRFQYYRLRPRV